MPPRRLVPMILWLAFAGAGCGSSGGPTDSGPAVTPGELRLHFRVEGVDRFTVRFDDGQPIEIRGDTTLVFSGLAPGPHNFAVTGLPDRCLAAPASGSLSIQPGDFKNESIRVGCGGNAFVLNAGSDDITVIHTGTATVRRTIAVENASTTIAVSPDGRFLYVTLAPDDVLVPSPDTIAVVDTGSGERVAKIRVGGRPVALAVSDDGGRLYAANAATADVSIVDARANVEIARVAVGDAPIDLALSRDGAHLYVAVPGADRVVSIDVGSRTVIASASLPSPLAVAMSVGGDEVYVTTGDARFIILDPVTLAVVGTIPLRAPAHDIAVTPDGFQALVAEPDGLGVVEIGSRVETWSIDRVSPSRVAVTPDGTKVYVVDLNFGWVQSYTNPQLQTLERFDDGRAPRDVVIVPG